MRFRQNLRNNLRSRRAMRLEAVIGLQWVNRAGGIMTVQVRVRRWKEPPEIGIAHPNAPDLS
jgi:hypothetical protein